MFFLFADPFAEDTEKSSNKRGDSQNNVHIRIQQRNGKKSLTTVQGLPQEFDLKKILKALKKGTCYFHLNPKIPCHILIDLNYILAEYCCNGCVVEDEDLGKVLQLQGDQRKNVNAFLIENELAKKDSIKLHGF